MGKNRTSIDAMADAVMEGLLEYADLAADTVKEAVTESAKTVKEEIQAGAPSRTGKYKKSWRTKKTKESSSGLAVTVHSKDRYQIAHLLEYGHAKRGGGRVSAIPHIAPAEAKGEAELLERIERGLKP